LLDRGQAKKEEKEIKKEIKRYMGWFYWSFSVAL
jgi:hypothetical protein